MAYSIQFPKLLQIEKGRWLLLVGFVAATHLFCQSLMLPYRNALLALLPDDELQMHGNNSLSSRHSSPTHLMNLDSLVNSLDLIDASLFTSLDRRVDSFDLDREIGHKSEPLQKDESKESNFTTDSKGLDDDSDFVEDANIDNDLPFEEASNMDESSSVNDNKNQDHELISEKASETRQGISLQLVVKPSSGISTGYAIDANASSMQHESSHQNTASLLTQVVSTLAMSSTNTTILKNMASNASDSNTSGFSKTSVEEKSKKLPEDENQLALQSRISTSGNGTVMTSNPVRKRMRCEMPPKSIMLISEMNHLLVHRRSRSRAMRPKWSSARDQEILAARLQIVNAPIVKNDPELYAPLLRNISMFKRSYELMERILKVYTYKDGEKPIFHQPILKGLYASEGWFMKLMKGNKRFTVKDPRKAHLFYMPFSSRMLEHSLYVRNSHNRTNLRQYLKDYAEKIAAKYPYWNRTGGADHFVVACHDWAPYETRHHMEQCIKALCNADVTQGFKIGRDVSLPETYVRSARNPLRDLGGKPPSKRHILAFYAGNMHGYLRKILLKHWLNKEPDMKIFGPMPPGVASKMNYIEHMKSSKFCICPKGYEVNSPRVVEAIFYECVPVIISDNFVPPFFEVLNWDAFSVILSEKDIPNLKDVLLAISEEEYLGLQQAVRKVQRHFLWHAKPLKYDLFHMALHSIWYNRVFQVKLR